MIKIEFGKLTTTNSNGYKVEGVLPTELYQGLLDFIETLESLEEEQDKAIIENMPDDKAALFKAKYDYWQEGEKYNPGDKRRWFKDGEERLFLYIGHEPTVAQPGWEPHVAHSLWRDLEGEIPGESGYPKWIQPGGSTDAYEKGFEVEHKGTIYKSTVDNNVWEPGVYGWEVIDEQN